MKIDLTCPVEVWRCDKPTEEYAAADITLYNLSDRSVNSAEVTLIRTGNDGRELDRVVHRGHSLRGRVGSSFTMSVPCEYIDGIYHTEVIIEKVWFDDNDVWRRGNNRPVEYVSNALPNCRALEKLHYIAGNNAVGFPAEDNGLWLCVCGRPNPDSSPVCVRCHRGKAEIFTRFNREAVEKLYAQKEHRLDLHTRAVREDNARIQQIREQEYNIMKTRHRRTRTLFALLLAGILLTGAFMFFGQPALRYLSAVRAISAGCWDAAVEELEAVDPFLRSGELLADCRYEQARQNLNSDDPLVLSAAADIFRARTDKADAAGLEQEADYRRACLLLQQGNADGAAAIFSRLGNYKDSSDKLNDCAFFTAEQLMNSHAYAEAESIYRSLGTYPGAADNADSCVYEQALILIEDAGYDSAAEMLRTIPDFGDSAVQLQRCSYLKALQLEEAGDLIAAGDAYRLAGDYEDAALRTCECLMAPADEAFLAGDLETAMELYAKIPDYPEAAGQYRLCAYTLASDALKNQEYARASELFSLLPDDYSDTADKKLQTVYKPAAAALKKKDWETAVSLFETIPGYKDSDALLAKARYGLAGSLVSRGGYAEAATLYELLGDYSDSEKKLLDAKYRQACLLLDAGEAEEAILAFEALSDHPESAGKLKAARYLLGTQLLEQGKANEARVIFESLGNYGEAAEQVRACDYALADALEQDGKTIEAAELFDTVRGYSDAADRSGRLYCQLAGEAEKGGRTLAAAGYYEKAGSFGGAADKAKAIWHDYYDTVYTAVKQSMSKGDYAAAAALMDNLVMTDLPAAYADLPDLYKKANYEAGKSLYNAKKPYEALPYFRAVPGYKSTDEFLRRPAYLLLGTWTDSESTALYIFREDGVCYLNGRTLYFNFVNDKVMTSDTKGSAYTTSLNVWNVTEKTMSLSFTDENGKSVTRHLVRSESSDIPAEPENDTFAVQDDEV
ncbi:MAG: hypothetical protein MJ142_00360 [Clostridia bacterium]|nr:hypothetical protein [Clostridia bacterium]